MSGFVRIPGPVRIFKNLDALTDWGDDTRRLQYARRAQNQQIEPVRRMKAVRALGLGEVDEVTDATYVRCPLCRNQLSPRERRLGNFVWGIDSVHYLTVHKIWPEELDWFIQTLEHAGIEL